MDSESQLCEIRMHFSKENNVTHASNVPRAVDKSLLNSFGEVLQPQRPQASCITGLLGKAAFGFPTWGNGNESFTGWSAGSLQLLCSPANCPQAPLTGQAGCRCWGFNNKWVPVCKEPSCATTHSCSHPVYSREQRLPSNLVVAYMMA